MKVSRNWLNNYISSKKTNLELVDSFTQLGLECTVEELIYDFQKQLCFKIIAFSDKTSKVLDLWSVVDLILITCLTFLRVSKRFQSNLSKTLDRLPFLAPKSTTCQALLSVFSNRPPVKHFPTWSPLGDQGSRL